MIPQISKDAQAILADISNIIPVIMHDGGKKLYILCDNLDEGYPVSLSIHQPMNLATQLSASALHVALTNGATPDVDLLRDSCLDKRFGQF